MTESEKILKEPRKPSRVSAPVAAIISLIIPGSGHMLARFFNRGLFFLFTTLSSFALLWWRIREAATRDYEFWAIVNKAIHLQPVLILLIVLVFLFYLLVAFDAYRTISKNKDKSSVFLYAVLIIAYFMFGWQIGEINLYKFVTQIGDAKSLMGKVIWPWQEAVYREEIYSSGLVKIQIPCSEAPIPTVDVSEGEAYLLADPACGVLAEQEGDIGTRIHITGGNFEPGEIIEFWWEDPIGNVFRQRQEGEYMILPADENGEVDFEINLPYRLIPSDAIDEESLIWELEGRQISAYGPPVPSENLKLAMGKLVETIFLGMMATFFGIIFAVPVSFLAARNLMSASPITVVIYYLVRTILNIFRSIESMIWAVIAVVVVGLGPFAGILALTIHTIAALGKLYSEAIESIDPGPIEAIHATGANWLQTVVYAVIPQIVPPFVSFTIYRWDINVRMSTVIGLVGGGGIGFLLIQWIRLLDYRAAGLAVWFITITVAVLDFVSAAIRKRFV
ncbi:MAG: phosphonate ABC transporter, permease protein PhnE [Anaerolineales bacterium]|nr:phosphonate ABC transporter, permease protein PhnE [Anaerolineales bacterium]